MVKILKVILAAAVIFTAGVVTGRLSLQLAPPSAPPSPERSERYPVRAWSQQHSEYLEKLDRELQLSAEQRTAIEQLLHESHDRMKGLWEPVAPRAREEFRRTREEIISLLNPEQRRRYEEVFKHKHRKSQSDSDPEPDPAAPVSPPSNPPPEDSPNASAPAQSLRSCRACSMERL